MSLNYPITRSFSWRWFTPISLVGSFIVIAILCVVNTALVGYETITVFKSDFNATPSPFWRSLQDQLFVIPVERRLYHGAQCRTIVSFCSDPNLFNMSIRTSFSISELPYSTLPGIPSSLTNNSFEGNTRNILDVLLGLATLDSGNRFYNVLLFSNHSSGISFSAQVNFTYCPMSFGRNASCAINPPQFDIVSTAMVFPNANLHRGNPPRWLLDNDTELAVYNVLQTVYAMVRIDLGNPSWNNFILNPAALNNTIHPIIPITPANGKNSSNSNLYSKLTSPSWHLPVNLSGPATIQLLYPCQFQQRKAFGSLVIAVLVATLSMFSSGWAIYMLLTTTIAKRHNPLANRCCGHCPQHCLDLDPSFFDRSMSEVSNSGAVYQAVAQSPLSPQYGINSTSETHETTASEH